uniref:Uncharacterized protein n=1 Tax=viral metagenome TaxID=1070528 RepID=A0A6C0DAL3_9ZZZZ
MQLLALVIIFLFLIILYQLYQSVFVNSVKEGLDSNSEYKNYDSKCLSPNESAFMLAQQNAGNIEYLKQQISKITDLDKEVRDMSGNLVTLNEQMIALVNQQTQAASQLVGDKPISTSGLSSEEPKPSESTSSSSSKSQPLTTDATADTTADTTVDTNNDKTADKPSDETSNKTFGLSTGLSSNIPSMGSSNAPKSATTFSLSSGMPSMGSNSATKPATTSSLSSNANSESSTSLQKPTNTSSNLANSIPSASSFKAPSFSF